MIKDAASFLGVSEAEAECIDDYSETEPILDKDVPDDGARRFLELHVPGSNGISAWLKEGNRMHERNGVRWLTNDPCHVPGAEWWMLRVAVTQGEVYVSSLALTEDIGAVIIYVLCLGIRPINCDEENCVYIPASWAKREFPEKRDLIERIERWVEV
jgi:hypothetical protein